LILKKTIYYAVAVAALAAAATVCVVFLALALYAGLVQHIGPAWAAASVAAAALTVTVALSALLLGKVLHHPEGQPKDPDLTMRVFELARDKPWVALGALGALGAAAAVAMRNPRVTSAVITTLLASRIGKK
jgi:hypothetical protein